LLCKRLGSQSLKGQRDKTGQAWEHGANRRAGRFFRCDRDQFKVRMEHDQSDELRSGITAGPCDGNANFSHCGLRMLQKPIVSPAQPERAETRLSPGGVLTTDFLIILLNDRSVYSCRHKKREGRTPSLFVCRLGRLIVWSIGTAFWRPSGRTSCALSLGSRG
jgi:hypothetical protein